MAGPVDQSQTVREPAPVLASVSSDCTSLTIDALRDRWAELLDALRERALPLEALMRSCEPVAVEGDVVTLGFDHSFHRSRVEEEQNRRVVEDVLAEITGRGYQVRCVLAREGRVGENNSRSTPAEATIGVEARGSQVDEMIANDPVLRAAVEDLGARVVRQSD